MDIYKPSLLVLTATITPPKGEPNLKRVSSELRMHDYITAMKFYMSLPTNKIDRILFIENSNNNLDELRRIVESDSSGKDIEVVSYNGLDYPPSYARGYGEFKMMDQGFKISRLLSELHKNDYFWKVTGRLRVYNIINIINTSPAGYNLLIDFKKYPFPMVDLRLYSCSRNGYEQLFNGRYSEFREDQLGSSVEFYLYKKWEGCAEELSIVQRHRLQPKIGGVGGQHNEDYLSGQNLVKYWGRSMMRFIAPSLWL
jgi:hypothetical protein